MKASSRKGWRDSRPWSATRRSSLPKLRSHRRCTSSCSSPCSPAYPYIDLQASMGRSLSSALLAQVTSK